MHEAGLAAKACSWSEHRKERPRCREPQWIAPLSALFSANWVRGLGTTPPSEAESPVLTAEASPTTLPSGMPELEGLPDLPSAPDMTAFLHQAACQLAS
jgi:hypothetical protein